MTGMSSPCTCTNECKIHACTKLLSVIGNITEVIAWIARVVQQIPHFPFQ